MKSQTKSKEIFQGDIKGVIYSKIKVLLSFTHPQVIPTHVTFYLLWKTRGEDEKHVHLFSI